MYSFVIDHEKEMKIQLLNAVMLRGLGPCSSKYEKIRQMFLCGFKNFHVHTYADPNRICPSTRIRIFLIRQIFLYMDSLEYSRPIV